MPGELQEDPRPASLTIALESPRQEAVTRLIAAADTYFRSLYALQSNHLLDVDTLAGPDVRFFVARRAGEAVGCGALRIDPAGYGEVKRMFVTPAARGMGVGARILARIEEEARSVGLPCLRLETGIHQPAAIALYHRAGFTDRGPFGQYHLDAMSLFMEKAI